MYVTRVRLSNIRGFTGKRALDLVLPAHGSWTVLAGRNASGKTTLLQAIALALGGPDVSRTLVADFSGWLTTRTRSGRAEATVAADESVDAPAGGGRAPKGPLVLGLEWTRPERESGDKRIEGLRPSIEPLGPACANANARRGPWAANPLGWFCAG